MGKRTHDARIIAAIFGVAEWMDEFRRGVLRKAFGIQETRRVSARENAPTVVIPVQESCLYSATPQFPLTFSILVNVKPA
jgi:hypothetical protein